MVDWSNNPIEYDHYSPSPIIGVAAPTLADIIKGNVSKKRKKAPETLLKKHIIKKSVIGHLSFWVVFNKRFSTPNPFSGIFSFRCLENILLKKY